jgi:hypothetical protein
MLKIAEKRPEMATQDSIFFMVYYDECAVSVMADGACGCCCFHMLQDEEV